MGEENWEGEAGGGWVTKSCPVKLLSYNFFYGKRQCVTFEMCLCGRGFKSKHETQSTEAKRNFKSLV